MSGLLARVGYGALFVVVVPALLVALGGVPVPFPTPRLPGVGWALTVTGAAIMVFGLGTLMVRGRGLPMNAFPPERLVTTGVFGLVPHPIYTGFCLATGGLALALGSPGGLWVSTPTAVLGCLALAVGHERLSLLERFGELPRPVLALRRNPPGWQALLAATERLANSWSSVRLGPVRIMNHVVWSGLAGGVGAAGAVLAAGARYAAPVALLMVAGAVGAMVMGQLLVGSSQRLSRPFGYFGSLAAIAVLGGAWVLASPQDAVLLAAFALVAPWTQAVGRLRCLVQGCCHGAAAASGIVVTNPHSRACAHAGLSGVTIHPTQLYSILGNLALGSVLLAAWLAHAPLTLVMGGYLVGAGTVRFIEEAYRGEPLTRIVAGLRIYQWFAVAMFVVGALVMLVPSAPAPAPDLAAWPAAAALGVLFFVVCGAAMSVDLPDSRAPLSRLSG